jgi:hypothetical protein
VEKGRGYYWKLLAFSLFRRPKVFPLAVTLSIFGYHFRKTTEQYLKTPMSQTSGGGSGGA